MNHRAHCRSHRKKLIIILLAVVLAVIACLLLTAASILSFSEKDETKPADTVIVLGASVYDNSPSPVFCERINHAISLYDDGYADTIIMTGGVGEGNIRSEADIAREYAEQKGVPAEAIYMEENSRTTEENLENAEHLMDKHGWDTALIVSDPIHMKRAMMYARDLGMKAYSSPTPTSLYRGWKTKLPFLIREEFYYIGYRLVRPFKSGDNSKSEDKPYGVFLSVTEDLSQFKDYGTVVIDAQYFTKDEIDRFRRDGHKVYSYINIGSLEDFRGYYKEYRNLTLDPYENWDEECWVDVSDSRWQDFIVGDLMLSLLQKDIDGFFVDNCDVYYQYPTAEMMDGLSTIMHALINTGKPVLINGGDSFVDSYCAKSGQWDEIMTGINQECVFSRILWDEDSFGKATEEDREYFTDYIERYAAEGADIYLLEYTTNEPLIETIENYCQENGFEYYISDSIELD